MIASQNSTLNFKVVLVGSSGVGKSSLLQRLIDDTFETDVQSTVGVEFKLHDFQVGNETIHLNIWDTAGQEKFRSVAKAYFRNAVGAILAFSTTNSQSFLELDSWLNDLHSLALPNAVILLVGNKVDLISERSVTTSEAEDFAERHGIEYLETSAYDGQNVYESFLRLARTISEKIKRGKIKEVSAINNSSKLVKVNESSAETKKCC